MLPNEFQTYLLLVGFIGVFLGFVWGYSWGLAGKLL